MRLFIAIRSLVPPWSESAQSPSSSLWFWNVHHSSVSPISHLNACSSCLRRFLCSPSQPVFISSSLTNIISKLKTIPLPRLFMKMLSCVVPRTHLMDTAQQISFHCMKWMVYIWWHFLSFNPIFAHAVFSPLQLLNLLERLWWKVWSKASLNFSQAAVTALSLSIHLLSPSEHCDGFLRQDFVRQDFVRQEFLAQKPCWLVPGMSQLFGHPLLITFGSNLSDFWVSNL